MQSEQTARLINSFVDNSTKGQIPEIVSPSALQDVSLMLINAIYFFGKWERPFDRGDSYMNFKVGNGNPDVTGDFGMYKRSGYFYQLDGGYKDVGILELPYRDGEFAMYLILPPEDMDIRDYEFNFKYLNYVFKKYMEKKEIRLKLPKFKFEYEESLKKLFNKLGVEDAFSSSGKYLLIC